ncbi:MAG: ribonuclease H-like domain-containing protein [Lachnospiraceae bacterium]|nr:ribonuclease H-like domain-containing protein [Lachnospiraceae bacterium]
MKVIEETLDAKLCTYDLNLISDPEKILFMDIETTGFAARSSVLYLIGCVVCEGGNLKLIQYFAEKPEDEEKVLSVFLDLCKKKKVLIHYNGNNFDLPYLKHKCISYGYDQPFDAMEGVDIYKRVMPYKQVLRVDNLKQKTMERFLDIEREDIYNGGELINVYREYVADAVRLEKQAGLGGFEETAMLKKEADDKLSLLLLHNADDMRGMLSLISLLAYADIFLLPNKITRISAKKVTEPTGNVHLFLLMRLRLTNALPKPLVVMKKGIRLAVEETELTLDIPITEGELKYFYGNYKEYYYLPEEDTALHKSVASFVSPDHRIQATAQNCYTRKEGQFLPEFDLLFEPIFRQSYDRPQLYFELTDELKHSPETLHQYAIHVCDFMFHNTTNRS